MHNIISRNQLVDWVNIGQSSDYSNDELDIVNDYFDCLIECDEDHGSCKKICRRLLY